MANAMLCLSIACATTAELIQTIKAYSAGADVFEVRTDLIADLDVSAVIATGRRRLIFTALGPTPRGDGPADPLRAAIKLGAAYVCADVDVIRAIAKEPRPLATKLIGARHFAEGTPVDLGRLAESADAAFTAGADVAKIVVHAGGLLDNFTVLDYLKSETRPVIAFCSGPFSGPSRILAVACGSLMTFCAADGGPSTAEGQLSIGLMRSIYDTKRLKGGFEIFGVAGKPVSQSWGPTLFNRLFADRGVNAIYLPLLAADAADAIDSVRRGAIRGVSVTIPFKEAVFKLLDAVDSRAAAIGAINTIVNRNGSLIGYNTDVSAALGLLPGDIKGRRVTLLGSGGAAMAVADGLAQRGAILTICGRSPERTRRLAGKVAAASSPWEDREKIDTDIWINATPIGMAPDVEATPLRRGVLRGGEVVFDMVYNPRETGLLKMAWQTGCKVIHGFDMFLRQAAEQYSLWFDRIPSPREMHDALEALP